MIIIIVSFDGTRFDFRHTSKFNGIEAACTFGNHSPSVSLSLTHIYTLDLCAYKCCILIPLRGNANTEFLQWNQSKYLTKTETYSHAQSNLLICDNKKAILFTFIVNIIRILICAPVRAQVTTADWLNDFVF